MSSRPALAAVQWMVSSRSSSRSEPSRAKRRSRRSATLMLRVPSSSVVVVVLVGALVPHLHRRAVAALVLPDADALRVVAIGAERAGAAGADHLAAAFVALLLLLEALLQRLHQLVPAHLLDRRLLFGREFELERLAQPLERDVLAEVGEQLHALEVGRERAVELVEVRLVLDQRGARQVVELVDRRADDAGLDGVEQGQVLLDRDLQLGRAQRVEEVDQHGVARVWRGHRRPRSPSIAGLGRRRRVARPAALPPAQRSRHATVAVVARRRPWRRAPFEPRGWPPAATRGPRPSAAGRLVLPLARCDSAAASWPSAGSPSCMAEVVVGRAARQVVGASCRCQPG